jgi:hypothetical protein
MRCSGSAPSRHSSQEVCGPSRKCGACWILHVGSREMHLLGSRKPHFLGWRKPHFLGSRKPHFLGSRKPHFLGCDVPRCSRKAVVLTARDPLLGGSGGSACGTRAPARLLCQQMPARDCRPYKAADLHGACWWRVETTRRTAATATRRDRRVQVGRSCAAADAAAAVAAAAAAAAAACCCCCCCCYYYCCF